MDQSLLTSPTRTPAARVRSVFAWLAGIACFGFLLSVIVLIAHQIIVPPQRCGSSCCAISHYLKA
jgi:hypothetical protein